MANDSATPQTSATPLFWLPQTYVAPSGNHAMVRTKGILTVKFCFVYKKHEVIAFFCSQKLRYFSIRIYYEPK